MLAQTKGPPGLVFFIQEWPQALVESHMDRVNIYDTFPTYTLPDSNCFSLVYFLSLLWFVSFHSKFFFSLLALSLN